MPTDAKHYEYKLDDRIWVHSVEKGDCPKTSAKMRQEGACKKGVSNNLKNACSVT